MMNSYYQDTITAVATPPGHGAISIVRLSGQRLIEMMPQLFKKTVLPRKPTLCSVYDEHDEIVDHVLVLFFPAPHSYTGEDVIEIHGHGGLTVTNMVLDQCQRSGARLAEPGEFSLRAYYNGKMNLVQAESVADIIHAQSELMVKAAARNISGEFSNILEDIKDAIVHIRTYVEAFIDFPEEEISFPEDQIRHQLDLLIQDIQHILNHADCSHIINQGVRVVLTGPTNAGKSSLFNALVRKKRALVSNIPGTTRDTIEECLMFDNIPLCLVDTAGFNESSEDILEKMGMQKSHEERERADIILYVIDINQWGDHDPQSFQIWKAPTVVVLNKSDTAHDVSEQAVQEHFANYSVIVVSALTGEGMDTLKAAMEHHIKQECWFDKIIYVRKRQADALRTALEHIRKAREKLRQSEVVAEELRCAQGAVREIVGDITDDEILGKIFSTFCIGK